MNRKMVVAAFAAAMVSMYAAPLVAAHPGPTQANPYEPSTFHGIGCNVGVGQATHEWSAVSGFSVHIEFSSGDSATSGGGITIVDDSCMYFAQTPVPTDPTGTSAGDNDYEWGFSGGHVPAWHNHGGANEYPCVSVTSTPATDVVFSVGSDRDGVNGVTPDTTPPGASPDVIDGSYATTGGTGCSDGTRRSDGNTGSIMTGGDGPGCNDGMGAGANGCVTFFDATGASYDAIEGAWVFIDFGPIVAYDNVALFECRGNEHGVFTSPPAGTPPNPGRCVDWINGFFGSGMSVPTWGHIFTQ
ncbi:MAG TPA: hypothetical protein VM889_10015 [Candidatus Thermoplasmatota archaeon]|nr:hypothetical protein [Candidatus Thermoplasmatota archaeon]